MERWLWSPLCLLPIIPFKSYSSAKSPSEKEPVLAFGIEKYIVAMRFIFVWQIWCGTNTISNILKLMVMVTLRIFDWKFPFADTLSQKLMVFSLILICYFYWWRSLFMFQTDNTSSRFELKILNYLLNVKLGT